MTESGTKVSAEGRFSAATASVAGQRASTGYDADLMARFIPVARALVKTWFRSEVTGHEHLPEGGALLVSNHSGGLLPMDVPILTVAVFDRFGPTRALHVLAHDLLFRGPLADAMRRIGLVPATREAAEELLAGGGLTLVFPGGDRDVYRPTSELNRIDFGQRVGYVRTAIAAGVPVVPVVSVGGHENQLYLSRGESLAKLFRVDRLLRTKYLPITFGFPFGLSVLLPVNIPLPTKIVTEILEPIDIAARFGGQPDLGEVDAYVRGVMQAALDVLASRRRFPVLG